MATSNNKANYGTVHSEKKLPFYRTSSRNSTDSTRSTDALLNKQPKKEQAKPVSTKSIYECESAINW